MSGIFGIYYRDGRPVDPDLLACMSARLSHRGPDGANVWSGGSVALGHRMLWTTPESVREHQPLVHCTGDLVITADARIDNRDELIAQLDLGGFPSQEVTDSRLILAAYEKWGEYCIDRFVGDFAFAIWDGRRQSFLCARDHFGIKPFYYYCSDDVFVFASEIKAILCVPNVPCQLNEVRIGDFLTANFEDKTVTFYQNIVRLPPAHAAIIDRHHTQVRRYWTPDLTSQIRLRSTAEYAEAFREVFQVAVRDRLRSAFPVGSTLSGGLDSSSIACVAAKILTEKGSRLHTFSAIFPSLAQVDPRIDERAYIDAVLRSGEFEPHAIHADLLSPLVEDFWQKDEVVPGINLYMDHAFCRVANQHGVRVLLSGLDGDSIISYGYERLVELARTFRWRALLRESKALSRRFRMRHRSILWHRVLKPLLPKQAMDLGLKWHDYDHPVWDANTAIDSAFAKRIGLADRIKGLSENSKQLRSTVREQHWHSIDSGLFTYAIELVDKIAAPFAVEPRHPFFDKRVVTFSLALPLEQKLQQGWPRAILRYAMADLLPRKIQWRLSKGNLSANFKLGLYHKEHKTLKEIIFDNPAILERYVCISALQQRYHRYESQPLQCDQEALAINSAVMLALWLRNSGLAL
jgi:asparagine synthase (glutamine-hydrolysing)